MINEKMLDIFLIPFDEKQDRDLSLKWKVESFDGKTLKIEVTFENPF
jgi:hypothetical protein